MKERTQRTQRTQRVQKVQKVHRTQHSGNYMVRGSVLYKFGRSLVSLVVSILFNIQYEGEEFIPRDTNYIMISNHISNWDPFIIAPRIKDRAIHFLAKDSLFVTPLISKALAKLHMLKINQSGGGNLSTMRQSLSVIRSGGTIGIFPEGHRFDTGKLENFMAGTAMLVMNTDIPVLPVNISGKYGFRKKMVVRFGERLLLSDLRALPKDSDTIRRINGRLMNIIDCLSLCSTNPVKQKTT